MLVCSKKESQKLNGEQQQYDWLLYDVNIFADWRMDWGTQRQFLENICSEDDLRSRIFGTFVVNFLLTCLS